MKLLGKSWKYISEGNVHIVLQLEGTDYVLRLIKEDVIPVIKEDIKHHLNFVNLVMVPLLKNDHCGIGELVELPPNSLTELSRNLQQYRPKMRLSKAILSQFAIKTNNLAIVSFKCKGPTFCIEIKPKEGFLSSSLRMYSRCYYCLKQYLKMDNQDINQTSAYCPLDLFSGNENRMKQSIEKLVMNPQNNFKIFKNGTMLYHDKIQEEMNYIIKDDTPFGNKTLLADFIVKVLLGNKNSAIQINESEVISQNTELISQLNPEKTLRMCNESNNLKPDSPLYNLLFLQKLAEKVMLHTIDSTEKAYDYVRILLEKLEVLKLDLSDQNNRKTFLESLSPTHLSLISAIAKDCSIMISFTTEHVDDMQYIDVQDSGKITRLYYKMAITDLEPKPITTLLKRKKTEQKIIETYLKHFQSFNKTS